MDEDEFTFAQRRAREGAAQKAIVSELIARGTSPDLAESVANGALADAGRPTGSRFSWLEIGAGVVLLVAGAALFYTRTMQAFGGTSIGFQVPSGIIVVGGLLLARGLFR